MLPLALGLLAAAEALRPAGVVLNARGSAHPEPLRLRTAAYRATPSLRHRLHAGAHPTDDRTAARLAGAHRCDRHAACPSRTPTAATSSRSPRPLRLTAALCPLPCPLLQCYAMGGGTQAPPTSLIGELWTAATAAAGTCCMHTAQPARDCQGARDTRHARGQPRMHGRRSTQSTHAAPRAILQRPSGAAGAADLTHRDTRNGGGAATGSSTRGLQRLGRQFELPAVRQALRAHAQCSG